MPTAQINPQDAQVQPSRAEWDRLLNRVIESALFRRSARLRDFLIFVGNQVVLHGATELHEQQIGVAVFDRQASYDTAQDNIVRVNAMELRKRIDSYFATEGHDEALIFEIPRGSYCPVFHLRVSPPLAEQPPPSSLASSFVVSAPPPVEPPAEVLTSHPRRSILRHPLVVSLLVAVIIMAGCLVAAYRRNQQSQLALHRWQSGPALTAFWGNFFGRKLPPEIVLADTSLAMAEDILHRQLTLAEYLDFSYRTAAPAERLSPEAGDQQRKDLAVIFSRNNGSIGDFRVARKITELQTGDDGTRLVFAHEYAGHRLRWSNTIFVGSSSSNPWVELFDDKLAYHLKQSHQGSPSSVLVDHPAGQEQSEYPFTSIAGMKTAYCLLIFLPNPTDTGNTLIVAGTDSQATEAGGDFLTSEEDLEKLQALFHQRTFPYFQVLLTIRRVNGTPLDAQVISYRVQGK